MKQQMNPNQSKMNEQMNELPCQHGKLSQAHRHSQSTCPEFPQKPENEIEKQTIDKKDCEKDAEVMS